VALAQCPLPQQLECRYLQTTWSSQQQLHTQAGQKIEERSKGLWEKAHFVDEAHLEGILCAVQAC
jgi:hypothetical protein